MPIDDDELDDDWDVEEEAEEDEDEPTILCPYCRAEIHEDTQRCPRCEQYISDEDLAAIAPRKPWWIILGAAACLYLVYRWTLG